MTGRETIVVSEGLTSYISICDTCGMDKNDTHPIRAARLSRDLSQEALGRRVGATKAAISKWENGRNHPAPTMAKKLAAELELSLEQVYAEAA
jgi:DNA-binding XRE family transcriptional regulator